MSNNARANGVHEYNINMFLQDDALTERICSDLEQLKYAQILTSLAMGPLFGDGVFPTGQETTARSLSKPSDEGRNDEVPRRHKRRVKPTPKVQEWNQERSLGTKRNTKEKRGADERKNHWMTKDRRDISNGNTVVAEELKWANYGNLKVNEESKGTREPAGDSSKEQMAPPVETTTVNLTLDDKCDPLSPKDSRYRCEQCGKCFKTYYTYSIHIRMPEHTEETPFVCDICGKGFRLSSTLCRHKIIHTSNKPHQCKICNKTFNRSSTLKMHMRTHSGRKQHVCAECGKGFHQKGNLRNHMFVHSGERPFHCESCGRLFNKKSNLKHHLKIHEINGKLACTVCKTMFPRNEELKKHMEMVHCK